MTIIYNQSLTQEVMLTLANLHQQITLLEDEVRNGGTTFVGDEEEYLHKASVVHLMDDIRPVIGTLNDMFEHYYGIGWTTDDYMYDAHMKLERYNDKLGACE
jgi:hypothetical protein